MDATRVPPGPEIAVLSVSASLCASSPPTPSCAHASISASICAEVTRQRAASCTSTQSCAWAPRAISARNPPSTVSARVGPPHSTLKNEGLAYPCKKWSPGATATSVPRRRATPAKAASVCNTIGWPATGWYCLGRPGLVACAWADTARTPMPAQGSKAQRSPDTEGDTLADAPKGGIGGSVMGAF